MGLALLVLIWLITLASTYFFVAKTWWLPVGASAATGWIDRQFALTFVFMGIVFVAAQLSLGYIVWRYRQSAYVSAGEVFARQYEAGNCVDSADDRPVHWVEPDGQQRVGEPALRSSRSRRSSGRGHGHAVRLVLPLSRGRMESTAEPAPS